MFKKPRSRWILPAMVCVVVGCGGSGNNSPGTGGSGGGFLKQGQYVDAAGTTNNRLLNTLLSAALQDTQTPVLDFGDGPGGMLDVVRSA